MEARHPRLRITDFPSSSARSKRINASGVLHPRSLLIVADLHLCLTRFCAIVDDFCRADKLLKFGRWKLQRRQAVPVAFSRTEARLGAIFPRCIAFPRGTCSNAASPSPPPPLPSPFAGQADAACVETPCHIVGTCATSRKPALLAGLRDGKPPMCEKRALGNWLAPVAPPSPSLGASSPCPFARCGY
jgi:hypothetical protein